MKILAAVDESQHSREALDWLARMPWPASTEVIVASVAPTPVMLSSEIYAPGLAWDEEVMKAEMEFRVRIANEAVSSLKKAGLTATTRVVNGDARLELVDLARTEQCDLVVVGSHGRTGLARLLLGSVAAHVVSHAPCTVVVVKPKRATTG